MLTGTGDLGRRLAEQRQRCGLSQAETADRAGLAVGYLEYLETSATADPGPNVLIRLADALGTTAAALNGGGQVLPPGQRRAAGHPVIAELTPARSSRPSRLPGRWASSPCPGRSSARWS